MPRSRFFFCSLALSFLVATLFAGLAAAGDEGGCAATQATTQAASQTTTQPAKSTDDTAKPAAEAAKPAAETAKPAGEAAKPAAATAKAPAHAYAGLNKCKMCHLPYFKAWSDTPHARAFAALDSTKKQDKDPKCVKCHVTGFDKGGYMMGKPATATFKNVQCEACHGAGADYMKVMKDKAKAKAAGLVIPTQEVCVGCHNSESPTFKGFDYAAYLAKGVHKVPKEVKK